MPRVKYTESPEAETRRPPGPEALVSLEPLSKEVGVVPEERTRKKKEKGAP